MGGTLTQFLHPLFAFLDIGSVQLVHGGNNLTCRDFELPAEDPYTVLELKENKLKLSIVTATMILRTIFPG